MKALVLIGTSAFACLACRPVEDAPKEVVAIAREIPIPATTPEPEPPPLRPDFVALADSLSPSVVSVVSTVKIGGNENDRLRGIGSGVIVSSEGEILTNEHVVRNAARVEVELHRNRSVTAEVVYADASLDLALLRVQEPVAGLVPVGFREAPPKVGEWVMAMGQPFALGNTVTVGVVSGLKRNHADLGRPRDLDPDGYWSFIQTDASVNVGNSGGPIVDLDGKVLGVTTAVRSDGQGLAFAVPSQMARRFLEEVAEHGRVRHPRLGIRAENAGPGAFPGRMGVVRVTRVDGEGPGTRAGLGPGDLILAVNGTIVHRVSEVAWAAQVAGVDAKLQLEVGRPDGTRRTLELSPNSD